MGFIIRMFNYLEAGERRRKVQFFFFLKFVINCLLGIKEFRKKPCQDSIFCCYRLGENLVVIKQ
jgi:hypothetical protein